MRRRWALAGLLCGALQGAWAQADTPGVALRSDGVYVSREQVDDETYCEYLRFYPTGTVITVSSECGPEALESLKAWFRASRAGPKVSGVSRGRVVHRGNRISFRAVSKEGAVRFEGHAFENHLVLRSHSEINGHDDQQRFDFVRW
ncbi:hypothetical protein [Roseateles sp. BYS87W]|uniref:Uncharacterized protein n=1 Tax=Pelomonas baiyunensis TaxID=3299026 RepID=A0ABW7GT68_9BURK